MYDIKKSEIKNKFPAVLYNFEIIERYLPHRRELYIKWHAIHVMRSSFRYTHLHMLDNVPRDKIQL